jgi:hypothetical protein
MKILRFIIMFTTARYSTRPWDRRIQFTSTYSTVISILTLPFRLYVRLPSSLFHLGFRHLCHSCHTVISSHLPWYGHLYNVWRRARIWKFLNTQFPPSSCYDFPLSSKCPWTPFIQTRRVCALPFHNHTKQTLEVSITQTNEEIGDSLHIHGRIN